MKNIIIMGAAGRDFHNFNVCFRDNPEYRVVAFTAAQIPFINDRTYPPVLSGPLYPQGIPIHPEERLPEIIKENAVDAIIFSYSDVSHEEVMHKASLAVALGADFILLGSERTMLKPSKPVISVCAVRTGCGKSGVTRYIARLLKERGKKPVVIRHPMPYGDLASQVAQRFTSLDEMKAANCTIEEMEEYEPLTNEGVTVYAGVDYAKILSRAENEADVIIWDGGNNDMPFVAPGLEIVIADPHRPGHELHYYPGEANIRRAQYVVINKADTAKAESINIVLNNIKTLNPKAGIIRTASAITLGDDIKGKKVLVIEDGPTLTHGGMEYGAGVLAAKAAGAALIDPRPYAVGTIRETFEKFPHLTNLLPAMGYSAAQVKELEDTINATPCDAVVIGTPVNLAALVKINKPAVRVRYDIKEMEEPGLKDIVRRFIAN